MKLQKEALDYYEDDKGQFSDQWRVGYRKRNDALITLLCRRQIKLSDDVIAEVYVGVLTNDLRLAIAVDVTVKWEKKKDDYGFEKKLYAIIDFSTFYFIHIIFGSFLAITNFSFTFQKFHVLYR